MSLSTTDIVFLNAGQGDSVLVRLPSNKIMLIDSNWDPDHRPAALPYLERWYEETGSADIELLCLTHPDVDHYRGLPEIVEWVHRHSGVIHNLIRSAFPNANDVVAQLKTLAPTLEPKLAMKLNHAKRQYAKLVTILDDVALKAAAGGGQHVRAQGFAHFHTYLEELPPPAQVAVYILGPTSETIEQHTRLSLDHLIKGMLRTKVPASDSTNAISCVLWIAIGSFQALLTGDATNEALLAAIDQYDKVQSIVVNRPSVFDIVKAGHHGAKASSSPEFWKSVLAPNGMVVFSAGPNSPYDHPNIETLQDIQDAVPSARLFCTNVCPMHGKKYLARQTAVSLNARFNSGAVLGKSGASQHRPRGSYHGTCRFSIKNGKATPSVSQPAKLRPYHSI